MTTTMRIWIAALSAALFARPSFAVGDSEVGIFVTPPQWAAASTPAAVAAKYTPLGASTNVLRLTKSAALGMCATLDGFAERVYVPLFNQADSDGRSAFYIFADLAPGPIGNWRTNDYAVAPWTYVDGLIWPKPANRVVTNSFGRIFPVASDMLEDVRRRLRSFAHDSNSMLSDRILSSSAFGGEDFVDFGWCSRAVAINDHLTNVADRLCYDWSCVADQSRPCLRPSNAVIDVLGLDQDELTNVFSRMRANAPAPLPSVYALLSSNIAPSYVIRNGWLTNNWKQARIDANDFGWMNKMIASIDKSYLRGGEEGLQIFQFNQSEYTAGSTLNAPVTNGYFDCSWNVVSGSVAIAHSIELGEADWSSDHTEPTSNRASIISYELRNLDASARLYVRGSGHPYTINPRYIADQISSEIAEGEMWPVMFSVWPDPTIGPIIEISVMNHDGSGHAIISSQPAVSGSVQVPITFGHSSVNATGDVQWTSHILPYGEIGTAWYTNFSGRHCCPLPENDVANYVAKINMQMAAKRSILAADTNVDDYRAIGVATGSAAFDGQAFITAQSILSDCASAAQSAFNIDVDNPQSAVSSFIDEARTSLANEALAQANADGSWSVRTEGAAVLAYTNGEFMLFHEVPTTNGTVYVELPYTTIGGQKEYIYAELQAEASGVAATNNPTGSLTCEIDLSAAVYWTFRNLPIEQSQ